MDWFNNWLAAKAAIIFAAVSGAVIHVTLFWSSPAIASRQLIAGILVATNFGPAVAAIVVKYSFLPVSAEAMSNAAVCATGLTAIYLVEGLMLMARRWSRNPTFFFWRKS